MSLTKKSFSHILVTAIALGAATSAQAALSLDRTRIIFDASDPAVSFMVTNDNKSLPFLAQIWLENGKGEKITNGPLVVTPPIQRMEPEAKTQVKIVTTPEVNNLPKDRETLFYFNLREVPPKSTKPNTLQIALQTKIKLFYRPEVIKIDSNQVWQNKLILHKNNSGYLIENPTPYYITIVGLGEDEKKSDKGEFKSVMVAPKSSIDVKTPTFASPWVTYINDYGGRASLNFPCSGNKCFAIKK
ncbi:fimbria/pilus periplasmic chaperone [Lelliottia sp. WAP21]|uniref:fimbria/pilus periplasmic chaperone n=1 Tax=Lelliottia sp. WAP21 TaxID=2877426 RepID=UPI001E2AE7B7|nr:fimbria/pilus periplasmic chaperone [Lelliottia sp. WAP21]